MGYDVMHLGHPADPHAYAAYVITFGHAYVWREDTIERQGSVLGLLLLLGSVTEAAGAALRAVVPARMARLPLRPADDDHH